jgi:nicotinamide riboside transporter PnuC
LLSSALVIFTIAITQHQTTWGVVVASISGLVCLYWGFAYSKLDLER